MYVSDSRGNVPTFGYPLPRYENESNSKSGYMFKTLETMEEKLQHLQEETKLINFDRAVTLLSPHRTKK